MKSAFTFFNSALRAAEESHYGHMTSGRPEQLQAENICNESGTYEDRLFTIRQNAVESGAFYYTIENA